MRCRPSYIRTIKPNQNRSGTEYDSKAILHQIKYLGLQENIRVRRAGFAYRNTFEKIVERFYLLSPATSYAGDYTWQGTSKSGCEQILKDTGIAKEEWQMGVTKAFIKSPETVDNLIAAADVRLITVLAALCARDHARPLLAQHGRAHSARFPELLALQERVRASYPALLEEQQGVHRVRQTPRPWPRGAREPEGTKALLSSWISSLHGGLP
jgi:myosin heavy subunit